MPEVWYAIPSANPALCRAHLPAWRERGYRVAVLQNRERGEIPADITVWRDEYPGWAPSVNLLCADIVPSSADIVVTGGDDMLPDPERDAETLAREFFEYFPDGFGVMQPTGDAFMHSAEYCGSPWLGRAWIEQAYEGSGPMHPGYHHNWADHELRWVSEALGALWMRDDVKQRHDHFSRRADEAPEYWSRAVSAHDRDDVECFIGRQLLGFPGHGAGGVRRDASWWRDRYPGTAHRHWVARYAGNMLAGDDNARLQRALEACAEAGDLRVGVYGGGTATRSSGEALRTPGVEVVCVIDDHPTLSGSTMWGFPICALKDAVHHDLNSVVVHVRGDARAMAQRAREILGPGVRVIPSSEAVSSSAMQEVLRVQ